MNTSAGIVDSIRRAGLALVALSALAGGAFAQTGPVVTPPRDQPAAVQARPVPGPPAATGSAVVRGRVLDDAGAPIAGARVSAMSSRPEDQPVALTDVHGRYELRPLPVRMTTLEATRAGYLARDGSGTARRRVIVKDGETREVDFTLLRPGVITGRVVGADGEPLADASVRPLGVRYLMGRRRLASGRNDTTDDLGRFRLHGLTPGEYYVIVTPRSGPRSGVLAPRPDPAAEGYTPTYYPGTADPSAARTVTVASGAEVNVDLVAQLAPLFSVSGTVLDTEGRPTSSAQVGLRSRRTIDGDNSFSQSMFRTFDGVFKLPFVPPGEYILTARMFEAGQPGTFDPSRRPPPQTEIDVEVSGDVEGLVLRLNNGAIARGRVVFATQPPEDVSEVQVRAMPAAEAAMPFGGFPANLKPDGSFALEGLRGRVRFAVSGGRLPGAPLTSTRTDAGLAAPGGMPLRPPAPPPAGTVILTTPDAARPAREGSAGPPPGPGTTMTFPGVPWRVRSVRVHGRDVTEEGLEVKGTAPVESLEIEVARDYGFVGGVVRDQAGQPAPGATVIALPADGRAAESPWRSIGPTSMSREDGRYALGMLVPGTFHILALPASEDWQSADPAQLLERFGDAAARVTIGPSQRLSVDLVLMRR